MCSCTNSICNPAICLKGVVVHGMKQDKFTYVNGKLQLMYIHEEIVVDHKMEQLPSLDGSRCLWYPQQIQVFVAQIVHDIIESLLTVRVTRKVSVVIGGDNTLDRVRIVRLLNAAWYVVVADYEHLEAIVQRQRFLHWKVPAWRMSATQIASYECTSLQDKLYLFIAQGLKINCLCHPKIAQHVCQNIKDKSSSDCVSWIFLWTESLKDESNSPNGVNDLVRSSIHIDAHIFVCANWPVGSIIELQCDVTLVMVVGDELQQTTRFILRVWQRSQRLVALAETGELNKAVQAAGGEQHQRVAFLAADRTAPSPRTHVRHISPLSLHLPVCKHHSENRSF